MFSVITTGTTKGINAHLKQMETDISDGIPQLTIIGVRSQEARMLTETVRTALKNSGMTLPEERYTVNIIPDDAGSAKSGYELPLALNLLTATGRIKEDSLEKTIVLGGLRLTGETLEVNGVLPIVKKAKEEGYEKAIVPMNNAKEAAAVEGMTVIGVRSIEEAVEHLREGGKAIAATPTTDIESLIEKEAQMEDFDFAEVAGCSALKRAAEIAAAGHHNLLMVGAPGTGRALVAKRIPSILPKFRKEEAQEVSSIYSMAGLIEKNKGAVTKRPFVSPHHTITQTAMFGGGHAPMPGVVSMAHKGVLFLDSITEFKAETLENLQRINTEKEAQIIRASGTSIYPADFLMVASMERCPCGYHPDKERCRCSDKELEYHFRKIKNHVLNTTDMLVEAQRENVAGETKQESSEDIRKRVEKARQVQEARFAKTDIRYNSEMSPYHIKAFCTLGDKEMEMAESIVFEKNMTAREYHKLMRVARTIADLDGAEDISCGHLTEAAGYHTSSANKHHATSAA